MFTEILTERLKLRNLEVSDARRIFEYRSHPDVVRFQSWGAESPEAIESFIRNLSATEPGQPGSWYQIGIVVLSSGELIGDCGFHGLETELHQAEIGITVAPEFQGQSLASEALRALLNYLLVTLDNDRVFGSVDPRNVRSMRLLQRVGMRKEAHRVKSLWFKGECVDDAIFAITASEWKSTNPSRQAAQECSPQPAPNLSKGRKPWVVDPLK